MLIEVRETLKKRYSNWPFMPLISIKDDHMESRASTTRGRPTVVSFEATSDKTKRRKTEELMTISPNRLYFATSNVLKREGHSDTSKKLKKLSASPKNYSPDEALSLMMDCSLTKNTYQRIKKGAIKRKCDLYPPYYLVREAKKLCCPCPENWKITYFSAELNLQEVLDHTTNRTLLSTHIAYLHQYVKETVLKSLFA